MGLPFRGKALGLSIFKYRSWQAEQAGVWEGGCKSRYCHFLLGMSQCHTSSESQFPHAQNEAFELVFLGPSQPKKFYKWNCFIRLNMSFWFHPLFEMYLVSLPQWNYHRFRKHWLNGIGFHANISHTFNKNTIIIQKMDDDGRKGTYLLMLKNEIRAGKLKVEFQGFQKICVYSVPKAELRHGLWKVGMFMRVSCCWLQNLFRLVKTSFQQSCIYLSSIISPKILLIMLHFEPITSFLFLRICHCAYVCVWGGGVGGWCVCSADRHKMKENIGIKLWRANTNSNLVYIYKHLLTTVIYSFTCEICSVIYYPPFDWSFIKVALSFI